MHRRKFLSLGASPWLAASLPGAEFTRSPIEISIDASRPSGTIRPLHGVNGGPLNTGGTIDLSPEFRELGAPLLRLHDCHWPNPDVVDMHVVFTHPDGNPENPSHYDFARTDEYITAALATGSGIVYRLGESIEHDKIKKYVHPPKDPQKWADACIGIIRHLNEGWAQGSHHAIRYWEIWNEPDNRPAMWSGTDEDYFRLYRITAKAIKRRFPKLMIGGPGLGNTGNLSGNRLDPSPFFKKFLEHCRTESVPLDFFSWHHYGNDPHELPRRASAVRDILNQAGFAKTESHLNEWNYLPDGDWSGMISKQSASRQQWHDRMGGPEGAAFTAASLILLQDAPLDMAQYFSAEPQGMGLFNTNGVPRKPFAAMIAFRKLTQTPTRLPIQMKSPRAGFAIAAGMNAKSREVNILISRFQGPVDDLQIKLTNLPGMQTMKTTLRIIDRDHAGNIIQTDGFRNGIMKISVEAEPTVLHINLRSADVKSAP